MSDRNSKAWRDCHTIAELLTARTCFEFVPSGQSQASGAALKSDVHTWGRSVGLNFGCRVTRWHSGDAHLEVRGCQGTQRFEVGGRGWIEQMIEQVAPRIDEAARRWARSAALLLESDAAPHAHVLLGVMPFSYFRHQLPPGWSDSDLTTQAALRDGDASPDLTIEEAWAQHISIIDPPGYEITRTGTDRGRALFVTSWHGRDCEGTLSAAPKDRAGCRADMWCDFFGNSRHALLDQLTRSPGDT